MIFVKDIQRAVAEHYHIPVQVMREPRPVERRAGTNSWEVSRPRQVAMCLSRRLTMHTYDRIGHFFGGRDHTTVMYAEKAAQERDKESLRLLTKQLLADSHLAPR